MESKSTVITNAHRNLKVTRISINEKRGGMVEILGVILLVTGCMVILSGYKIIRSTQKTVQTNTLLVGYEPSSKQKKLDEKTEQEYKKLVKNAMRILYIVGITCILVGILMILLK